MVDGFALRTETMGVDGDKQTRSIPHKNTFSKELLTKLILSSLLSLIQNLPLIKELKNKYFEISSQALILRPERWQSGLLRRS
jgi:hypothetical protein